MTNLTIARRRLLNQQLAGSHLKTPAEIVRWLGAVQSQDYLGARWAIGLRAGLPEAQVEQAVTDGSILRLHVLRPTWHFVTREDIRWMLALTSARVIAGMAYHSRNLNLDEATFRRSQDVFRQALAGGQNFTRAEMAAALRQGGISTDIPQVLGLLLMRAELDSVICSGPRRGKQPTVALLDERAPVAPLLEREQALSELARRFFTSHGPAGLKDFSWWSGLTVADARAGVELAGSSLAREEIDGQVYWSPADLVELSASAEPQAHLLPNYDEYTVAYTNRDAILGPGFADRLGPRGGVLNNVILIDGLVVGNWKRELRRSEVVVTASPLWPLTAEEQQAVERAARQFGEFLSLPVKFQLAP